MALRLTRQEPNGRVDGVAPAAGEIGEIRTAPTGTTTDIKNVTASGVNMLLPAGVWDVTGVMIADMTTVSSGAYGLINCSVDTSVALNDPNLVQYFYIYNATIAPRVLTRTIRFNFTTPTTVYLVGNVGVVSGSVSTITMRPASHLSAVRVA